MIRWLKSLFGIYDAGYEYWVYLKDIKVPDDYRQTQIGEHKWNRKVTYWFKTGIFQSPIIIDHDFNLIDGYSSVEIDRLSNMDKVPVYFVD